LANLAAHLFRSNGARNISNTIFLATIISTFFALPAPKPGSPDEGSIRTPEKNGWLDEWMSGLLLAYPVGRQTG
jgi:hypothetical protein